MARNPGSDKILSLVVPTYNMEKYLPACLDSVTDELIGDSLEVIVVNDGSTDRSPDIIRQYEQKRPDLIKVIDKPNGHYGSCVNAGLAVATGKYFKILDADDWFDTQALAAGVPLCFSIQVAAARQMAYTSINTQVVRYEENSFNKNDFMYLSIRF